jgi:translation elongation factor EF-Tu-like GTPase
MRELPKDVEAEITLLPTEHGGRASAVRSNYRPQFYYAGHDWDAVHYYPDVVEVRPGDSARVYLGFLSPDEHVGRLCPGQVFLLREGNHVVGYGKVTRLLDLEASAARIHERRSR